MPDDTIINKVITFISGSNENDGDDKQILLKQLAKDIQQNKYAKFYRPRTEEADPSFAQYFYSIYKIVYPAKSFLKDPANMEKIKSITMESYLDKHTLDVIKRLSTEALEERRKNTKAEVFSKELEKDLETLMTGFDSPKLTTADKIHNLTEIFNRFVSWDYYSMLKKFDQEMKDDFSTPPKFIPISPDTIMGDIASFLSVLPSFDPKDEWKTVLEIFKYCKGGTDLIPQEIWNGLLANLKDLKQSKILDSIIKLASNNPVWELRLPSVSEDSLTSLWLAKKILEVRQIISGIAENQKNVKISALEKVVFGTAEIMRLSYYSKEKEKILVQKELEAYTYAPALNHLYAFIEDFINKEIADLSDILLVRGQWTKNSTSIVMSDAYHSILDIIAEIKELDESLSDEGNNGIRLRGALLRSDRDPSQARSLNIIIRTINNTALNIINKAIPSFVVVGKHIKMLMEDCQKKPYELIMNWKELMQLSKTPMAQRLSEDYKSINYFIQLMLLETKAEET